MAIVYIRLFFYISEFHISNLRYINIFQAEKGYWENAAIIIKKIGFPRYKQYIPKLLEWLQDINWPGALDIVESLSSMVIGFTKGYGFWYTLYTSLQEAFSNVFNEAQCDALYGLYRSHEYVGAYIFAILTWMLVVCIDYVIGQFTRKRSKNLASD